MTTETSTQSSTSKFSKYLKVNRYRTEALEFLTDPEQIGTPIGELLSELSANDGEHFVTAIQSLSVADIVAAATSSVPTEKKVKASVDVPSLDNAKDAVVRDGWKARALAAIEAAPPTEDSRGLAPAKIRELVGSGSETQGREMLKEMEEAKQIAATGKTKSKKFVAFRFLAQAELVYAAEQAAIKAKADAAAEAKAKAAATPAPEATPVVDGKGKGKGQKA